MDNSRSIVLDGKYQLMEELGRGAMGTVFRAKDVSLQRKVAVKFLLPELASSVECADRFRNEAVGMAAIRDNNVAQIYSYGVHGENPFFVMEYLDGHSVESLIDSHNCRGFFIPLEEVLEILIQTTSGLAAIHRAGAVHRDIKPANIMLSGDPMRTVIMDFGLVRNVQVEDEVRILAGTPAYIAPELVEGRVDADRSPLTDIYSLGATAFEILTGSLPFDGDSWVEILRKHITEIPPYPSERRPGTPEALDEIINKAISKAPNDRYETADQLLEDLIEFQQENELQGGRTISSPPPDFTSEAWRAAKRVRTTPGGKTGRTTPRGKRSTGGRGRLLVADQDTGFRTLVHDVAKAAVPGCRVKSTTDGAMALRLMDEFKPTVVVIDLSLPEVNGFELVATIRGDDRYEFVELIVVSDAAGKSELELLKNLSVREFITKPIDANTLAEILRPALERYIQGYRSSPPADPLST